MDIPAYAGLLKGLRKTYSIINPDDSKFGRNWKMFPVKEYSNSLIYNTLNNDAPCMIARFGSNELSCMCNYLGVKFPDKYKNFNSYIKSQSPQWWWQKSILLQLNEVAGFFPVHLNLVEQFCELMFDVVKDVDILGSWLKEESFVEDRMPNVQRVMLEDLEPFFVTNPWTRVLENKKVLVVHPFVDTIEQQYQNRNKLFDNNLLPNFELLTIKAVQSYAKQDTQFENWFYALDYMKNEISKKDFDICIIGCGAYGFPLASYVKRLGKKSIHLAGVTQLLFGIKGKRWENYIVYPYKNLYNEYWVRPSENERPVNASLVEGATYW